MSIPNLCLLPIFLSTYSKAQRDARRQYVAVLAGIPKNIKEADLTDIANQVSAKAINIPLSYTFYKLKPYVYINFFSQETLDSALKLTVSFKNQGLTWHLPDQLDKLYSRFKTGPQRGRNPNQFFRHSSSRSRSCSCPSCSAHNTGNRSNNSRQSGQGHLSNTPFSTGPSSSRTQQSQPIGRPLVTPPTQTYPSITPEEIAALR
ncbi:6841_t:CDS:2, partial [Rhizophagus irregularis]